ncbi:flagellar motor switch protein FliN [Melaminivora jejuensis]|uniref:flagellar motor switch protein FliN n=1 Tax=Melaminivora jejuensis TaxID=1267217 RepID=UPI001AE02666|nr:flagellar motor switch protein FliN [Melaminivora jejuensis]UHJ64608.1 flagellar motor switch protein FliN [Melaminivora jejuensis]
MSSNNFDKPGDIPPEDIEDESLADWAQALDEQKRIDEEVEAQARAAEQGGPLSGDPLRPSAGDSGIHDINMVLDIPVQLSVELGRTKVPIKYILQLAQGSVVELDALAGEPMDVLVNGYLIAQGEVVVVNDKFGIRLTDVVTPSERLRRVSRG